MRLRNLILSFAFLFSACGGSKVTVTPIDMNTANSSTPSSNASVALGAEEQKLFDHINALRAENNLAPLQIDAVLQKSSSSHSAYMSSSKLLTHSEPAPNSSSSARIQNAGGDFTATAENVAYGFADADSTFNQWSSSASHRASLISAQYQFIGISHEGLYWTADFGGR